MTEFDYDLFVIGGGSGGVRAGRLAAGMGKRVAIAEEYRFGGTCVIRGCVPKKLFVYASQFPEHFEDSEGFGWSVGERSFDWKKLIAAKDKEHADTVRAMNESMRAMAKQLALLQEQMVSWLKCILSQIRPFPINSRPLVPRLLEK